MLFVFVMLSVFCVRALGECKVHCGILPQDTDNTLCLLCEGSHPVPG